MYTIPCRVALLALGFFSWCATAAPARVLFPTALHLTRQVLDPLTGSKVIFEEYCHGNRVVSVSGDRTVITDYDRQEIVEIDRRAGTYSISRFSEVASVSAATEAAMAVGESGSAREEKWTATPRAVRGSAAGRAVELFEFAEAGQPARKIEVGIDRSVVLSEEAVEVLIGAAYPNPRRDEHEPLLRAAGARQTPRSVVATGGDRSNEQSYGLPVTQALRDSDSGSEVVFRIEVTRIGAEIPPPELLIIPPAAKRVESRAVAVGRELRELDRPSASQRP